MSSFLLLIILIPTIEIYLFIKIGSQIGAISTIFLIFTTAIIGVYYAKYEGLNTLKSAYDQLSNNQPPTYEVISGALIALGAIMLIIPGFGTDLMGFLIIFPLTRKILLKRLIKKFENKKKQKNDFIEGEFEDIEDRDGK